MIRHLYFGVISISFFFLSAKKLAYYCWYWKKKTYKILGWDGNKFYMWEKQVLKVSDYMKFLVHIWQPNFVTSIRIMQCWMRFLRNNWSPFIYLFIYFNSLSLCTWWNWMISIGKDNELPWHLVIYTTHGCCCLCLEKNKAKKKGTKKMQR